MQNILRGLLFTEMCVYLDDIIVHSVSLEDFYRKTRVLFDRLREANLKLQPGKVQFLRKEVAFLGHIITPEGVKPDPEKIKAVIEYPTPKNVKNVRQALGFFGYYRRFIKNYAAKAKPLTALLQKEKPFEWKEEQEESFQTLKSCLINAPILVYPDFEKTFTLTTDASDHSIGAVLSQKIDGFDHPVAYLSKTLNGAERNYCSSEKEMLAALIAMDHFRPYLISKKFILQSDCEPLRYMKTRQNPGQRLLRWMYRFADYDYDFKYRAGSLNVNADALSRNPPEAEAQIAMIRNASAPVKPKPETLGEEPFKRKKGLRTEPPQGGITPIPTTKPPQ